MILYLDASALVKLYVEETGSAGVAGLAAALEVRGAVGDLEFASFDARLDRAAARERLRLARI